MSNNRHPLESEVLTSLYHYLAKKNKHLESCPLVMVPQTIVYEHNFPTSWCQQNPVNKEFKKKSGKELETKAIMSEFTRNVVSRSSNTGGAVASEQQDANAGAQSSEQAATPSTDSQMMNDNHHGIIAQFISQVEDEKTGEIINNVEFLDVEGLDDFLFKRKKRDKGILQQFVTPKGPFNFVIQAIWSPHVTKIERRVNIHRITDRKNYSPYERAVTYEGPSHYSNEVFCAPHLEKDIKKICSAIVEHFFNVEHKTISRMVLYFKLDPKNTLYLLWSSSIRIEGPQNTKSEKQQNTNNQKNEKQSAKNDKNASLNVPEREPLNLSPKFAYNPFEAAEGSPKEGGSKQQNYEDVLEKLDKKPRKQKAVNKSDSNSNTPVNESIDMSHTDDNTLEQEDDLANDEEFQKIKADLQQELDDLMYNAYSHFLHNSSFDDPTMEFPFLMPTLLKKAFTDEQNLVSLFAGKDLHLVKDEQEVYTLSMKQCPSMNKLQHQFTSFKQYLMDTFVNEGYYEANFKDNKANE